MALGTPGTRAGSEVAGMPTSRLYLSVPTAPDRGSTTYVAFGRSSWSNAPCASSCCRIELIR